MKPCFSYIAENYFQMFKSIILSCFYQKLEFRQILTEIAAMNNKKNGKYVIVEVPSTPLLEVKIS